MVHPQLGGEPIAVKQWCMLLNLDSMKAGTETCMSATWEVVEKLLERVLEDTMTADEGTEKKLEWNGMDRRLGYKHSVGERSVVGAERAELPLRVISIGRSANWQREIDRDLGGSGK